MRSVDRPTRPKIIKTQPVESPFVTVRRSLLVSGAVVAVAFIGFGGWAAVASIDSAAVASGTVAVSSKRQTIQHLEGGIIAELRARDGDFVEGGDLLVRLDDTKARANYELVRGQYMAALGENSRLEAERDGSERIHWAKELVDFKDNPDIDKIIRGQQNVFQSRKDYVASQQQLLRERQLQTEQEIEALDSQQRAEGKKLALIAQEMAGVEELYKKGLEKLPRLLALQRASADIEGNRGQLLARMARARQSISELNVQDSNMRNRLMTEVVGQLRDVETRIADLSQRLRAGKDILDRIEVRAPRAGYVVSMNYHTVGGVIEPGRPILDLVPTDETLLVETRLDTKDIDVLTEGLRAEIILTPYSARSVPPLRGTLIALSADSIVDQKTGIAYYAGRVEVDRTELQHLKDVKLVPGMPAQVMIRTGQRTALEYFVDPFRKSINRAFRES